MRHVSFSITLAFVAILVALAALHPPAFAADKFMGVIIADAGEAKSNKTTAAPFPEGEFRFGTRLSIQCDGDVYLQTGRGSEAHVDAGNGLRLPAHAIFDVPLASNENRVAVLSVEEQYVKCKVFAVTP